MSWIKSNGPLFILIVLGFWVMVLSFGGILFNKEWIASVLALYALLIILVVLLIILRSTKALVVPETVEEFEKSLKGEPVSYTHLTLPTN